MPSGVTVAGLGSRIVAALVDSLPIALIAGATNLILATRQTPTVTIVVAIAAGVLALGWALYVWWGYATRGAGPGAALMRIQVLGLRDGQPIGWGRYFLRELVWFASAVFVIPWVVLVVMMITHQRRQGWHDLAAKSVAVKRARVLESGGSVARSSVSSANTVGLPPHLAGGSFAGQSFATELPSSQGYTPTALGSAPVGAPISSVPSAFAPAEQTPAYGAAAYQPQAQAQPVQTQAYPGVQQPAPPLSPVAAQPAQPAPYASPQAAPTAVPWEQWGVQAPSAQPPVYPQQGAPQVAPVQPQQGGYSPVQSQPGGYSPQPAQPFPTYPVRSVPPQPQVGYVPQSSFAPQPAADADADDVGGTHLASRSTGATTRGAGEGWQVRLDDGRVIDIDGLVLFGRNPSARADEAASQLISTGDSRMVSKTHLAVGTDSRGLYVTDRGSTNGTAIANANGDYEPCAAGDKVRVREGQVVSFGDRYLEIRRTH